MTAIQVVLVMVVFLSGFLSIIVGFCATNIHWGFRMIVVLAGLSSVLFALGYPHMLASISRLQEKLEYERERYSQSQQVVFRLGAAIRDYLPRNELRRYLNAYAVVYWALREKYMASVSPRAPEGDEGSRIALVNTQKSFAASCEALREAGIPLTQQEIDEVYALAKPAPESQ